MLKEERELIAHLKEGYGRPVELCCKKRITALVRACYEDAAKVAEKQVFHENNPHTNLMMNLASERIAAAIRAKGKK